jgi:nucleoside 2-deoxyribosyltransferase
MENPEKAFLLIDNNTGRHAQMPRTGYEHAKRSAAFHSLEKIGLVQPQNVQEIWYVDEEERNKAIIKRKPFCEQYEADSYFKITQRIDNNFIEGVLGHPQLSTDFFADITRGYKYFDNYLEREKIYFTFDRISLFQVTEILRDNPIRLLLKRIDNIQVFKPNTAFMIMPFGDNELESFYEIHIRKFLREILTIEIYRADNFTDNDIIIETIYNSIEQSEFVIAEITHNNKNAFYELGYAVAKNKEVITLQNKDSGSIFFDRAHVRSIIYSTNEIEKFKTDLIGTIQTIRSRK